MLRSFALSGVLILSGSCSKSESSDGDGSKPVSPAPTAPTAKPGSGGGFSADLAKEIGAPGGAKGDGSGSETSKAGGDAPGKAIDPKASDMAKVGSGNA